MTRALLSAVRGVLLPGDEAFDAARRPWNLAVDQPVSAVDGLINSLCLAVSRRKPLTALTQGETAAATFAPDVLAKLREIKRRRDRRQPVPKQLPGTRTVAATE